MTRMSSIMCLIVSKVFVTFDQACATMNRLLKLTQIILTNDDKYPQSEAKRHEGRKPSTRRKTKEKLMNATIHISTPQLQRMAKKSS